MTKETAQKILQLTQKSYEKIADDFSNTRNFSWTEIDGVIKKYISPGANILDLGCGNGRLLTSLKKIENFSYAGLDNCSALITKAQGMQETEKPKIEKAREKIKFICGDILDLSQFNNDEFDIVFMIASFNHVPSQELREKLLLEVKRILKPSGFLIMTNWNLWQLHSKKSVWSNLLSSTALLSSSRKRGSHNFHKIPFYKGMTMRDVVTLWQNRFPLYYHAFTLKELKKLFQKTNFKILENYYVKQGQKKYWWSGNNILTVGQKI